MPVLISSPIYRQTGYSSHHPLGIQRIGTVIELCQCLGWLPDGFVDSPTATEAELSAFHEPDYIRALKDADQSGAASRATRERYGLGTMENPIFAGMFERAATSVGGSVLAARLSLEHGIAYHPAGGTHHGRPERASGFCYFNDPVFAVLAFLEAGLERVLYVDLDAHHGDGVEEAFAGDRRVLSLSVHEDGRWPHTGQTGFDVEKMAVNAAVPKGINDSEFDVLCDTALAPLARAFEPQALVLTCGADALKGDPLSSMALSNGALWRWAMSFAKLAPHAVIVGGGGYNPWTTARCWAGLWARIAGHDIPESLPKTARDILAGLESDLVDEDEIEPHWLTGLADPAHDGPVREAVRDIAARLQSPSARS